MKKVELKGAIVALVTPFKNGKIDYEAFKKHIDFVIENGVSGVVPCGTTGESATLDYEEHEKLIEVSVEHVNKRVPVIAGTGSNSTKEAIKLSKFAEKAGADALLLITPYYNRPSQKGLIEHFKAVAEEVEIPLIMYNVPSRTGVNMLPETVARLSEIKNIKGIKEASGNISQISEIIRLCGDDFVVLSGDDALTFPVMALGGKGVISVTANIVPSRVSELTESLLKMDYERARKIHFELSELTGAMFIEVNPVPVKTALFLMKRMSGELRLPLAEMSEENLKKLKAVLKKYNLIQ